MASSGSSSSSPPSPRGSAQRRLNSEPGAAAGGQERHRAGRTGPRHTSARRHASAGTQNGGGRRAHHPQQQPGFEDDDALRGTGLGMQGLGIGPQQAPQHRNMEWNGAPVPCNVQAPIAAPHRLPVIGRFPAEFQWWASQILAPEPDLIDLENDDAIADITRRRERRQAFHEFVVWILEREQVIRNEEAVRRARLIAFLQHFL